MSINEDSFFGGYIFVKTRLMKKIRSKVIWEEHRDVVQKGAQLTTNKTASLRRSMLEETPFGVIEGVN